MKNPLRPGIKVERFKLRARAAVLGVLGFCMLTTAVGCSFFQRFSKQTPVSNAISDQKILHLDQFVVNLADPDADAFLRVGIDIGVRADSTAVTKEGVDPASVGLVRDTVLKIITTRTSGDLLTPQGKDDLKKLLLEAIQKRDPALGATSIYFTDFLVQR